MERDKLSIKIKQLKTFEKNNPTIALNIFYTKEKEIFSVYISNHNLIREKQIILLMIPNEENSAWYYLAVKKRLHYYIKKTSSNKGNFYCLNCFYSFSMENKLKSHGEV